MALPWNALILEPLTVYPPRTVLAVRSPVILQATRGQRKRIFRIILAHRAADIAGPA